MTSRTYVDRSSTYGRTDSTRVTGSQAEKIRSSFNWMAYHDTCLPESFVLGSDSEYFEADENH